MLLAILPLQKRFFFYLHFFLLCHEHEVVKYYLKQLQAAKFLYWAGWHFSSQKTSLLKKDCQFVTLETGRKLCQAKTSGTVTKDKENIGQ